MSALSAQQTEIKLRNFARPAGRRAIYRAHSSRSRATAAADCALIKIIGPSAWTKAAISRAMHGALETA